MSGPDVVTIQDMTVTVAERQVETVSVGYTQITSEGSHSHTAAQVGADASGTAVALMAAHAGAADPHPAYLTQAEADGRYVQPGDLPAGGGGGGATYPLEGYGLLAASGDPLSFFNSAAIGAGQVILTRLWIPAGVAVTALWCAVRDAGTPGAGTTANQLALYTDAGVLVTSTANDPAIWGTAGWRGGAVQTPVEAQDTGRWAYIGIISGHSGVTPAFPSSSSDSQIAWFARGPGGGNRRAMYTLSQTALPASFDPTGYGTATTFFPLVGIT